MERKRPTRGEYLGFRCTYRDKMTLLRDAQKEGLSVSEYVLRILRQYADTKPFSVSRGG